MLKSTQSDVNLVHRSARGLASRTHLPRVAVVLGCALLGVSAAAACSSSQSGKVRSDTDAGILAGGTAGKGGTSGNGGTAGSGGTSGNGGTAGSGGTSGNGGTAGSGGSAGCTPATANGTCDTFPTLCGCTASQNCDIDANNETACVAAGTTGAHAACDSTKICQRGYSCVGTTCKPYCDSQADCTAGPHQRCIQVVDSNTGDPISGVQVCAQNCNLRDPANTSADPSFGACGAGATCVWVDPGYPGCYALNTTPPAACDYDEDCVRGSGCDNAHNCRKWCRVGKTDCSGTTPLCRGFSPALDVTTNTGIVEYGFCQPAIPVGDGGA